MVDALLWLTVAALIVVVALLAWSRYRRHQRRAHQRSLAALNRLLADADEIAQRARQEKSAAPDAEDGADPTP